MKKPAETKTQVVLLEFADSHDVAQVLVKGVPQDIVKIEELIKIYDVPAPTKKPTKKPTNASKRVRVVWLTGGTEVDDESKKVPNDLDPVLLELESLGVSGVKLVAQTIVQAKSTGLYELTCSPKLVNTLHLTVSGTLQQNAAGSSEMDLVLEASEKVKTDNKNLKRVRRIRDLKTSIVAKSGHPVVLCVSPDGEGTSVFIVQILD